MSCWVVPSIAADLWGVSIEQVLQAIAGGEVANKSESGFTFVDVAPHSPKLVTPRHLRAPTPPTYTVVTHEEIAALQGQQGPVDEMPTSDWRQARNSASRQRKSPVAA